MNKKYICFSFFSAFLMCFPILDYSQSCHFEGFKNLFYENDSTTYPNNTVDAVNVTPDSAYFVGGSQVAKVNYQGNRIWNGSQNNNFFGANPLPYITPDGEYYLVLNNFTFMHVDDNENIIWQKNLLDTNCYCNPMVNNITKTSDGGFIITGSKTLLETDFYRDQVFIVKTTSIGDTLWTKTIAESSSNNEGFYAQETADGGYLVLANIEYVDTNATQTYKVGVIKLNSNGQEQWFKTESKPIFYGAKIKGLKTNDGDCVVVASIDSVLVATYFLKINENGDNVIDTVYNDRKFNGGLIQLSNNDYLIGMQDSLSKIDGTTNAILGSKAFIGSVGENIPVNSIKPLCDNGIVVGGNSAIYQYSSICCGSKIKYYNFKSYLFKVDSTYQDVAITGITEHSEITLNNMFISPNPFSTNATIILAKEVTNATLKITDILGREVRSINFSGKEFILEKADMKPGIYFVRISEVNKTGFTKKIVVQ